ncbi:hypothetical protein ACIOYV_25400 [Pseudomonas sp. NPDC087342]|uniref:hypothetical protein n=1 Tax=Pseudomonas sp. NPDC087342 TaxID=3364437 RepID=UPI0038176734
MAATLGRSGIQPPSEGCFDPVITVLILELRIEEKFVSQAKRNQKAPSGHCVNIDVSLMALFLLIVDFANA